MYIDADGDQACDSRLAAFLAVHMVKQILDDAYVIANSAIESGKYVVMLQSCISSL